MTDGTSRPDTSREPGETDDLAALVAELSTTLESLRETVGPDGRGPGRRGPTPPTPRELLRFTEQYTIPTLIALLESGVRSLELLGATLRLLDGRGIEEASPATRERVQSAGRTTLDRVDAALVDLQSALEGGEPSDPAARDLLADARALREEIDRRLAETADDRTRDRDGTARRTSDRVPAGGRDIPVRSADEPAPTGDAVGTERDDEGVPVDVDAELESIRRDVKGERDGDVEGSAGEHGGGEDREDPGDRSGSEDGDDASGD